MRTTLVSLLAVLAQWGLPASAQPQMGTQSPGPAVTNEYVAPLPTKRFFFLSDPKTVGQPAVFARPTQTLRTSGFRRPYVQPIVRFRPTSLLPPASPPSQDFWRFLKPKNTRLFYFTKP